MMFKKIILATFVVCLSLVTNAQVKIKSGIRGGVNFHKLLDNVDDTDISTGFYFGGFATIQLKDFFAFQPELTFSKQGGKVILENIESNSLIVDNGIITQNLDLSYLKLSLMSKFFPFSKKNINFSVGPSINVLVDNNLNQELDKEILPTDVNLVLGVGYEFSFGLGIETRYNRSFIDIFGNNIVLAAFDKNRAMNRGVELGLYYKF